MPLMILVCMDDLRDWSEEIAPYFLATYKAHGNHLDPLRAMGDNFFNYDLDCSNVSVFDPIKNCQLILEGGSL